MINFETLKYSLDIWGIGRLELQRPEVHNALNMQLIREMRQALRGFGDVRIAGFGTYRLRKEFLCWRRS